MTKIHTAIAFFALCLCSGPALAVVTFDWATVGNPNNPPDQFYPFPAFNEGNRPFGSVAYTYRISKHEVTNAQYTEFLNAVDPMGTNPNFVYQSSMGSSVRGGIDFNAGASSGSKYSAKTNMGNKPVNLVSFFDAMRFVNWLENGQPTDGSGTEIGVYTIVDDVYETRNPSATYFIPSEDEWYKAAYHQPATHGGDVDDFWLYSTASNSEPTIATANAVGDISNPGPNVANYLSSADWNGQDGNVTTVGSAGPLNASFYGTFDQGGNVWEWTETAVNPWTQVIRGGSFLNEQPSTLAASDRAWARPYDQQGIVGFRVASIPEPTTGLLGLMGMLGLTHRRRRRS